MAMSGCPMPFFSPLMSKKQLLRSWIHSHSQVGTAL
jgi:hypothetical protein